MIVAASVITVMSGLTALPTTIGISCSALTWRLASPALTSAVVRALASEAIGQTASRCR